MDATGLSYPYISTASNLTYCALGLGGGGDICHLGMRSEPSVILTTLAS